MEVGSRQAAVGGHAIELEHAFMMQTYKRLPVEFVRGEGTTLYDADGRQYLDFLAGISVCSTGHCHPHVVEAIREQAGRLAQVSNVFYNEPAARLAERLATSFEPGARVFLCNSGTEANEAALKLARRHRRGGEIVVLEGAFHGRTMGALSATPQPDKQDPFAPLVPGFRVVAKDDPDALAAAVGERTAAVLLEPVQGETGVWPISERMLIAAREACDRAGALLMFDEIQCGMGRTGTLWAFELTPVRPDVLTSAKALASGLPVGACIAGRRAADVLRPGDHGATFGGGPLVAAAALATLDVIDDDALLSRVRVLGDRLRVGLEELRVADRVKDVRGRGLMQAVDLHTATAADVVGAGLEAGIVLNATGPSTVRFLPPLIVTEPEVDRVLAFLAEAL
jgi:predicted acetylornithine/succinylornithine family transaminase